MKPCLKRSPPIPSPGLEWRHTRKCVAFDAEGSEEVHFADEWDRTPTEPARSLTYQDVLELREIQRSLPRANQLPDPLSRTTVPQYLSAVPLALLPLLPESDSAGSRDQSLSPPESPMRRSSPESPTSPASPDWLSVPFRSPTPPPATQPQPQHLSYLSHLLPAQPVPVRPKPKFSFLPLLDTPPASDQSSPYPSSHNSRSVSPDPSDDHSQHSPTPSLTNASIDSSPSRTSSASPDPSFLQLPPHHYRAFNPDHKHLKPPYGNQQSYFPPFSEHNLDSLNDTIPQYLTPQHPIPRHPLPFAVRHLRLEASASPSLLPPSPLSLSPIPSAVASSLKNPEAHPLPNNGDENPLRPSKPRRRRNFIVVNDVEIEVDAEAEDEGEDDEEPSEPGPPEASPAPASFEPEPEPAMISIPDSPSPSPTPSPPPTQPPSTIPKHSPLLSEHPSDKTPSPTLPATLHSPSPIKSTSHSPRIQRTTKDRDLSPGPKSAPYCVLIRRRPGPS